MALATDTELKTQPEAQPVQPNTPPPLDFLTRTAIHPDNAALLAQEQQRWRLLNWRQRWRMRRMVARLARQLRRADFNGLVAKLEILRRHVRLAKAEYQRAEGAEAKAEAKAKVFAISDRARPIIEALKELKPTYELFHHYAGWLEYEAANRAQLKADEKRRKRQDKEMRREAKILEQIIRSVWAHTDGCHYTYSPRDGSKKLVTKTPEIELSIIQPHSHTFVLKSSTRKLLGWRWQLPRGVEISRLMDDDVLLQLEAATHRQVRAVWNEQRQLMFVVSRLDAPDAMPRLVHWSEAMRWYPKDQNDSLPYTIGVREDGKFKWLNLASNPHILVAGKSQSGKSNLVNGMIGTWVSTHTPQELRLVLVDQKGGVEFSHWHELPHVLGDVIKTVDGVAPTLRHLVAIMQERLKLLERVRAKNIAAYNSRVDVDDRLARVVIILDELNTLVGLGGLTDEIHNLIALLTSQGRAVGFHVVACTQHPEVKVVPGRIKTNMDVRISGAMPSDSASMIVLDTTDAAHLPAVAGRMCCVLGMDKFIVQAPFISDDDIAGVVSSTRLLYPDVPDELRESSDHPKVVVWDESRVLTHCVALTGGLLGGQKLHQMLGNESPGERHLSRVCGKLKKQLETVGYLIDADGVKYVQFNAKKKGVWVERVADATGGLDAGNAPESSGAVVGIAVGTSENIATD